MRITIACEFCLGAALVLFYGGCQKDVKLIDAYRAIAFQSGSFGIGGITKPADSMKIDIMGGGTCMSAMPAGEAVEKNGAIVFNVDFSKGMPPECTDTVVTRYECVISRDQVMKVYNKKEKNIDTIDCRELND